MTSDHLTKSSESFYNGKDGYDEDEAEEDGMKKFVANHMKWYKKAYPKGTKIVGKVTINETDKMFRERCEEHQKAYEKDLQKEISYLKNWCTYIKYKGGNALTDVGIKYEKSLDITPDEYFHLPQHLKCRWIMRIR